MRVLLVGGGGREHALAWKISRSPGLEELFIAPGNAGTAEEGTNVPVKADDVPGLLALAKERRVDLVVVGPEAPLVAGLADRLAEARIPVFGPGAAGAELEGSKAFAKAFMRRHAIPTAEFAEFTELAPALAYLRGRKEPPVVKADGLAAGKGVVVPADLAEGERALNDMLGKKSLGAAGAKVVIEERLTGREVSLLAITDGETVLPLATARDHKRALDGDQGPNTGGMGAYSPAPDVGSAVVEDVLDRVLRPTIQGLKAEGRPYRGVLYAGLMISPAGKVMVLEFNCRFGDPETQPLMMRLESDLLSLLFSAASADGSLARQELRWDARAATCVVMAADGYPGKVETGDEIRGLEEVARLPEVKVFHAGTAIESGRVVTAGGRVLGVTGLGADERAAAGNAYLAVEKIRFRGAHYRRDIGKP